MSQNLRYRIIHLLLREKHITDEILKTIHFQNIYFSILQNSSIDNFDETLPKNRLHHSFCLYTISCTINI